MPEIIRLTLKWTIYGAIKFAAAITPKKPEWWEELEGKKKNERTGNKDL